ncbi:hypothetical protein [Pyrobaculum ferrireducens]|uniref:Uncharacterized protein n=1 Tax=Pyrobaculum ferrireducens TaxID=1104324 RepID=G7VID7_9CREN|nr:hypothetical protein [Pyrobaculum ferrireducens]AET33417.1 hypothetical protein P186_2021 [Pyrobaculum ferrireducens]
MVKVTADLLNTYGERTDNIIKLDTCDGSILSYFTLIDEVASTVSPDLAEILAVVAKPTKWLV